ALVFDMGQMTDAELVAASRRGERAAFGALVERYQGVVCAVSYSRTGDRALSEDVAQETFIAAWRHLDRLRETVKLRSWLCGIARNLAGKARKRSDRETAFEGELVADGNPFDSACDAESERLMREAMSRVPETYREPLLLHYSEGLSVREIADALELSEAAVMQRLSRGRQYLAAGVTDLVERALRAQRTRRSLVAAVLAGLPLAIPSPAEASTSSSGGHMLKLALIAAGIAVTGTTAVIVNHARSSSSPTAEVAPTTAVAAAPNAVPTTPPWGAPTPARPAHVHQPTAQPALAVSNEPALPPPVDRTTLRRLALDRGPTRGPADAPVTIVMFTDAMCPYCSTVLATIDEVWDEFPGKLRLVVKQFPVHTQAVLAAEASLAADAQGKYWQFHDQMFASPDDLGHDALIEDARRAGMDVAAFTAALDSHSYAEALAAEQAAAKEIEISATPSFLINGQHFIGARPAADMRAAIVAALAP
ncbi:MAG: sigma-70 family RNA polymerase sigma factor, partial [Polyangiales bacterium]